MIIMIVINIIWSPKSMKQRIQESQNTPSPGSWTSILCFCPVIQHWDLTWDSCHWEVPMAVMGMSENAGFHTQNSICLRNLKRDTGDWPMDAMKWI